MDMVEQRIAQLEQRLEQMGSALERAEREARARRGRSGHTRRGMRLIRLAGVCGMAVTVGALTMGTAAAKPGPQPLTVRAPFTVVTNAGQALQVNTLGQLTLYHAGHPIVVLGSGADAAGLVRVQTLSGQPVAELASLLNGTGALTVVGDEGQTARLGASPNVLDQLTLRFYQGTTELAGLGGGKKGGLVQVNDAMGKKMAKLGSNGTSGEMSIYDADGSTKMLLGTNNAGRPVLDMLNGTAVVVALEELMHGGALTLGDTSGTERVAAGVLRSRKGFVQVSGPKGSDFIIGK